MVLENYYPDRFPSFWKHISALADGKQLVSVSEVSKELDHKNTRDFLLDWVKVRQGLFTTPTTAETSFVAGIFAVTRFQALVKPKNRLKGSPVADPWVIARARSEEHTSELQSRRDLVCRLLLEKKKKKKKEKKSCKVK